MYLYNHQKQALERTKDCTKVAYYHDMGLGKTFVGAEKLVQLGDKINLIVCQKSKVDDWIDHFKEHYSYEVFDLTDVKNCMVDNFVESAGKCAVQSNSYIIGIINYDLIWRREKLRRLPDFTLLLDESSLIQTKTTKRTKFIVSLHPKNVILLSGTPTGGRYEKLLTQMNLLGWKISEKTFWNQYVVWEWSETSDGFKHKKIKGYKNEDRMKRKMRKYGCDFLKTEDVFDLPEQTFQKIKVDSTKFYHTFEKNNYVIVLNKELIGDTVLKKLLYERMLCGAYNNNKYMALLDILNSTCDRIIIFYNFDCELEGLKGIIKDRPISIVNGKEKDLSAYENNEDSVVLIQYQAGAMGLNLQKSNKIIYFTPPLSSELFEQSKKRTHRIGQERPCFYYYLVCKNTVEEKIYKTLAMRRDYTEKLFKEEM